MQPLQKLLLHPSVDSKVAAAACWRMLIHKATQSQDLFENKKVLRLILSGISHLWTIAFTIQQLPIETVNISELAILIGDATRLLLQASWPTPQVILNFEIPLQSNWIWSLGHELIKIIQNSTINNKNQKKQIFDVEIVVFFCHLVVSVLPLEGKQQFESGLFSVLTQPEYSLPRPSDLPQFTSILLEEQLSAFFPSISILWDQIADPRLVDCVTALTGVWILVVCTVGYSIVREAECYDTEDTAGTHILLTLDSSLAYTQQQLTPQAVLSTPSMTSSDLCSKIFHVAIKLWFEFWCTPLGMYCWNAREKFLESCWWLIHKLSAFDMDASALNHLIRKTNLEQNFTISNIMYCSTNFVGILMKLSLVHTRFCNSYEHCQLLEKGMVRTVRGVLESYSLPSLLEWLPNEILSSSEKIPRKSAVHLEVVPGRKRGRTSNKLEKFEGNPDNFIAIHFEPFLTQMDTEGTTTCSGEMCAVRILTTFIRAVVRHLADKEADFHDDQMLQTDTARAVVAHGISSLIKIPLLLFMNCDPLLETFFSEDMNIREAWKRLLHIWMDAHMLSAVAVSPETAIDANTNINTTSTTSTTAAMNINTNENNDIKGCACAGVDAGVDAVARYFNSIITSIACCNGYSSTLSELNVRIWLVDTLCRSLLHSDSSDAVTSPNKNLKHCKILSAEMTQLVSVLLVSLAYYWSSLCTTISSTNTSNTNTAQVEEQRASMENALSVITTLLSDLVEVRSVNQANDLSLKCRLINTENSNISETGPQTRDVHVMTLLGQVLLDGIHSLEKSWKQTLVVMRKYLVEFVVLKDLEKKDVEGEKESEAVAVKLSTSFMREDRGDAQQNATDGIPRVDLTAKSSSVVSPEMTSPTRIYKSPQRQLEHDIINSIDPDDDTLLSHKRMRRMTVNDLATNLLIVSAPQQNGPTNTLSDILTIIEKVRLNVSDIHQNYQNQQVQHPVILIDESINSCYDLLGKLLKLRSKTS